SFTLHSVNIYVCRCSSDSSVFLVVFFLSASSEIYSLSLHDALPISEQPDERRAGPRQVIDPVVDPARKLRSDPAPELRAAIPGRVLDVEDHVRDRVVVERPHEDLGRRATGRIRPEAARQLERPGADRAGTLEGQVTLIAEA